MVRSSAWATGELSPARVQAAKTGQGPIPATWEALTDVIECPGSEWNLSGREGGIRVG